MEEFCFGVDVGGTTVKMGLFAGLAEPLHTWEIPTRTEDGGKNILPDIREAMSREMVERGIAPDQVVGAGVGIPGPVTDDGVVNHCVNLGWPVVHVREQLSNMFYHLPIRVGNDANVAALGEAWFGGGKGYRNMVMLTLGTGLGGGVIMNGRIVHGSHGAGGEVGHMPIYTEATRVCNCGNTGCLEQIASATGLVHKAREVLVHNTFDSVLRGKKNFTAKDVLDAYLAGDPAGKITVECMLDFLGRGMAIIATVVDPDVFVIGGGVSKTGPWLMEALKERFDHYAFFGCRDTLVLPAKLGNDAGMYGAAALAITKE